MLERKHKVLSSVDVREQLTLEKMINHSAQAQDSSLRQSEQVAEFLGQGCWKRRDFLMEGCGREEKRNVNRVTYKVTRTTG